MGAEVLWPIGPKNKHNDFPNKHSWHWKLKCLESQTILLFDTKKFKTRVGWPNRWCYISTKVKTQANQWTWGIEVVEDSDKT